VFVVDKGRGLRLASCLRCAVDGRVGLAVAKCFGIKMPPGFLPARVLRSDGQTPAGVCARVECVACDWIRDNEAAAVAGSGCVPDHLLRVCVFDVVWLDECLLLRLKRSAELISSSCVCARAHAPVVNALSLLAM